MNKDLRDHHRNRSESPSDNGRYNGDESYSQASNHQNQYQYNQKPYDNGQRMKQ